MFNRLLCTALTLLLSSAPCLAEGTTVGDQAPNFTGARTFHDDGKKTFADHRGEVVVLVFFCTICKTQWIQKPLERVQARYGDRGLSVVGCLAGLTEINEKTTEEARKYVEKMSFKVWFGADLSEPEMVEPFSAYRPRTRPQCMIVGSDGRIIWVGKPGTVDIPDRVIEKALRDRLEQIVAAHPDASSEVVQKIRAGNVTQAYEMARQADLSTLADQIAGPALNRLKRADALHEKKRYLEARTLYQEVSRSWKGTDLAERSSDQLRLYRTSAMRREISLLGKLRSLEKRLAGANPNVAARAYQNFARRYPKTGAATQALEQANKIDPNIK